MNPFIKMLLLIYLLSPDIISAFQFDDARFEIDFGVNPKKVEKLNLSLPPADLCLPTLDAEDLLANYNLMEVHLSVLDRIQFSQTKGSLSIYRRENKTYTVYPTTHDTITTSQALCLTHGSLYELAATDFYVTKSILTYYAKSHEEAAMIKLKVEDDKPVFKGSTPMKFNILGTFSEEHPFLVFQANGKVLFANSSSVTTTVLCNREDDPLSQSLEVIKTSLNEQSRILRPEHSRLQIIVHKLIPTYTMNLVSFEPNSTAKLQPVDTQTNDTNPTCLPVLVRIPPALSNLTYPAVITPFNSERSASILKDRLRTLYMYVSAIIKYSDKLNSSRSNPNPSLVVTYNYSKFSDLFNYPRNVTHQLLILLLTCIVVITLVFCSCCSILLSCLRKGSKSLSGPDPNPGLAYQFVTRFIRYNNQPPPQHQVQTLHLHPTAPSEPLLSLHADV